MVRSPSGDIDIMCLFLSQKSSGSLLTMTLDQIGRSLIFTQPQLAALNRKALLGLHALSGNGYVSSSFHKSKKCC